MSGRIRTVKPEWLDDERLAEASSDARVLSLSLILMADDVGRGRVNKAAAARVFPADPSVFEAALAELRPWYVRIYEVRGQRYFQIRNWAKHQRVDKPSKPHTPEPEEGEWVDPCSDAETLHDSRERLARVSRETPEILAPDHDQRPTTNDQRPPAREPEPAPAPASEPKLPKPAPRAVVVVASKSQEPATRPPWREPMLAGRMAALLRCHPKTKSKAPLDQRGHARLSEPWALWHPEASFDERFASLERWVQRWLDDPSTDAAKMGDPISSFIRWCDRQEGLGIEKPYVPYHEVLPVPPELTAEERQEFADVMASWDFERELGRAS